MSLHGSVHIGGRIATDSGSLVTSCSSHVSSSGLEDQNRHLTQIEIDEVLGLVCDIRAKVTAHNAMPSRIVFLVEFLLDESCDILLNVVLLQSLRGTVDGILLHVLGHVGVLDHSLAVSHGRGKDAMNESRSLHPVFRE